MTASSRLGGGHRFLRAGLAELPGVQTDVELRDVETERLDHALQPRHASLCDAMATVRLQAAADHRQIVEQLVCGRVAVVPEPPPHEGELAPVRLECVPGADLGCVSRQLALVPRERRVELGGDRDQRARSSDLDRERAHLVAVTSERERPGSVERLVDRGRPGARVAVHVAADPRPERERRRRSGQALAPDAQQLGRRVEQAVLEEPERVADLVRDPEAVMPHLVGLPEKRHLFCNAVLGLRPLRG